MVNSYTKLKDKHTEELNAFSNKNCFWAFSEKQFEEGMQKLGLDNVKENYPKLLKLPGGGFLLKEKESEWDALFKKFRTEEQDMIDADTTGTGYIKEMFVYEMNNHEYSYTGDISDTLRSLGLTLDKINANENLLNGFRLARQEAYFNS